MKTMLNKPPVKQPEPNLKSGFWQNIGLVLVSAATLCFEINLTRLFSVAQFYHFAFMVVSMALLGFGASGTYLALRKIKPQKSETKLFSWFASGAGLCILGAYLLVNHLPFDSFSMVVDPSQILILLLHYAALASPFFFSGMIISLMLRQYRSSSGDVYALNLVGSASGCLVAVTAPAWVDGEGLVAVSIALAAFSALFFTFGQRNQRGEETNKTLFQAVAALTILLFSLFIVIFRLSTGNIPAFFKLEISPYKSIAYALQPPQTRVLSSRWNSFSKVEVVSSPSLHSLPGLSYRYPDSLPAIHGLFVDGDNLNAILPAESEHDFAPYLPASIAYQLKPGAEVLVLEPKGGMAILAALSLGDNQVSAVEANPLIIEAAKEIYTLPGVRAINASGRSFLRSRKQTYDIIHLPLTDSYHPVSSGAYALGEDYRYTVEAFADMLSILNADGVLVVTRWLQEDPSEWLRTFALAVTALEAQGLNPQTQIIALRGYNTGTLLVKKNPFNQQELHIIRSFASEKAFDLVTAPDISTTDINRYNILPEPVYYQTFTALLQAEERSTFYQDYPFDVQPPTDDQPFFSHYFKWRQIGDIFANLGATWQPFGGAGYLVILVIFILAVFLASFLILLPALVMKRAGVTLKTKRIPLYFGMIGLAFMLVEIPLIQRFILYLDQPAYAFAAILFCILLFSGLGSRYGSPRLPLSAALIMLVVLLAVYVFLLPPVLHATLGLTLWLRGLITLGLIAPLGFLMGIPFPGGLKWSRREIKTREDQPSERWMIAWVWAVNGASSVLASILASLIALSLGFTITSVVGVSFYLLAWLLIQRERRKNMSALG